MMLWVSYVLHPCNDAVFFFFSYHNKSDIIIGILTEIIIFSLNHLTDMYKL